MWPPNEASESQKYHLKLYDCPQALIDDYFSRRILRHRHIDRAKAIKFFEMAVKARLEELTNRCVGA